MKTSLLRRIAGMGTAIAAASLLSATMMPSAEATGVLARAGTASLPTLPCPGGCAGTASLTGAAVSTPNGTGVGTINANYPYFEPNGLTCPGTGTANGTISGAGLSATFGWTRIGLVALVSLTGVTLNGGGEPNGTVVAVFARVPAPPPWPTPGAGRHAAAYRPLSTLLSRCTR